MSPLDNNELLDLRGVPCPQNSARTLLKLAQVPKKSVFKVIIDGEEAVNNVILSVKDEGGVVISKKNEGYQWLLAIKKR